jgi:putative ABC transport system ATP-binding protein
MISLRGVDKDYVHGQQRVRALRGVSLDIEPGDFVGLVGPSGSGKSTLLNIIACLDRPTAGECRLFGVDTLRASDAKLAELRTHCIGMIFQTYHLLARASALRNVELPMLYAGTPAQERRERAQTLLHKVGLGDRWSHTPAELSGGQQQRVAIARAIVNRPQLLLADEPTGALDRSQGQKILSILMDLNRRGTALVIVTHDPQIAQLARRAYRIEDGRLEALTPATLLADADA